MVYFGRVQNGKVVPEAGTALPEGARVRIEPVEDQVARPDDPDAVYRLAELAVDDDLPADLAREHDHYLYGSPKRGTGKP